MSSSQTFSTLYCLKGNRSLSLKNWKRFVNDYKMLLVEARKNNLIFHNINNVDFFNMLEMILDKSIPKNEAKEKVIKYAGEHHVDKTVIMTVAGATNCKIDYLALNGKGVAGMYNLFDEIAKDSKAEGIIETGFDCGLSENDILERLQSKLNVSMQMAQEYLKQFGKQTIS